MPNARIVPDMFIRMYNFKIVSRKIFVYVHMRTVDMTRISSFTNFAHRIATDCRNLLKKKKKCALLLLQNVEFNYFFLHNTRTRKKIIPQLKKTIIQFIFSSF